MRHRDYSIVTGAAVALVVLGLAGLAGAGPLDTPGASKALTCSACHGPDGNSRSEAMPVLAGMAPAYFKKAIEDYASGRRVSPEMEPYAKMVRELGADDVAAHFAGQTKQPSKIAVDPAAAARGKAASLACVICHGAGGKGDVARLVPDLTGQPAGYLRNQMLQFKADRRSPGDETLKAVKTLMKAIPDETLADLAAYYSSLR